MLYYNIFIVLIICYLYNAETKENVNIYIYEDSQVVRLDCTGFDVLVIKIPDMVPQRHMLGEYVHILNEDIFIEGNIIQIKNVNINTKYSCQSLGTKRFYRFTKVNTIKTISTGVKLPTKGKIIYDGEYCVLNRVRECENIIHDQNYFTVFNRITKNNQFIHEYMENDKLFVNKYVLNDVYYHVIDTNTLSIPNCNNLKITSEGGRSCDLFLENTCSFLGVHKISSLLKFPSERTFKIECQKSDYTLVDFYLFKCPFETFYDNESNECNKISLHKYFRFILFQNSFIHMNIDECNTLKVGDMSCSLEKNSCRNLFIVEKTEADSWYKLYLKYDKIHFNITCLSKDFIHSSINEIMQIDETLFLAKDSSRTNNNFIQYDHSHLKIMVLLYQAKIKLYVVYGSIFNLKSKSCHYYKEQFGRTVVVNHNMMD